MSGWLVGAVTLVYAYISVEQFFKGNPSMGITYGGYAIANIGLLWVIK